jgi:phenylpropionate dioxygenase-like ring-hydroxylating dioxygenase large terminal subunit
MERLFLPAWHFAGTTADLPRPGDFLTLEVLGHPVLVRNIDGEIHAFLNACAHRHCLLTHERQGHTAQLRCQYHGWEYTREGRTAQIPDAGCFRPFDRENARLKKFRTATCGQLVFVSLADEGQGLEEYLGDFYPTLTESFAPPFRLGWQWQVDFPANWKVPVENTLEMYHLPCLHRKTFGKYTTEENCTHVLAERSSTLQTHEYYPWVSGILAWMIRRLGGTPTHAYTHHHVHPNFVFIGMDVFRLAEAFVPTSPTTTSQRVWLYTLRGPRKGPLARAVGRLLRWLVVKTTRAILQEDLPIFADVQRGLQASPHRGVLGTIEERVHCFQEYVLRTCGESSDR